MLLSFNVEKQIITRTDTEKVVTNSMNYLYAQFSFSDEWTGEKTAVFKGKHGTYNALLDAENKCLVPWEILTEAIFDVSVFCGDLITANAVKIFTIQSGYEVGDESRIPTPEIYTQVINKLNEIEAEIDPEAIQRTVDEYLADKEIVTEDDVEAIVSRYISDIHGIPTGGTTGQVLTKKSNSDYDTEWSDASGGGINADSIDGLEYDYDYQLITPTVTQNKLVRVGTGAILTASSYDLAEITVSEGEEYTIVGTINSFAALCVIVDANNHVLYSFPTETRQYISTNGLRVTIPEGGVKLYSSITHLTQYTHAIHKAVKNGKYTILNKHDALYGKKWYACGDSFTYGYFGDYTDADGKKGQFSDAFDDILGCFKTYPWWIRKRCGIEANNTLAVSGVDFTNITGATQPFSDETSPINYTLIPTDCDYITFAYGLNETNLTTEQIGTSADTTNETLWGAYYVVLNSILTSNPTVKIGIIISDAWMTQTYHDALIEIAKYWGIPYLDLKDGEEVPMMLGGELRNHSAVATQLRDAAMSFSTNNHPTVKGHEYRSTVIENFLRSL